jgi:hypothetical protein
MWKARLKPANKLLGTVERQLSAAAERTENLWRDERRVKLTKPPEGWKIGDSASFKETAL